MKQLVAALALATPLLTFAAPTTWNVDASHSQVGFAVKHLVISTVRGEFTKYAGVATLDDADPSRSSVSVTIESSSIDTRVADRDGHLRSPDFLDVAKYPAITFKSTKVTASGKDRLAVAGDLTLHGVTRPVVLELSSSPEVQGMFGETRRAFSGQTRISRKDFGLVWSKVVEAGPVIGDELAISLDVELVKDAPKSASR